MELSCPQCATRYRASEGKIPRGGGKVRCPKCEAMIVILPQSVPPGSDELPPQPEEKPAAAILSAETIGAESAESGESTQEFQPEGHAAAPGPDQAGIPSAGEGGEVDFLSSSLAEQEEGLEKGDKVSEAPATVPGGPGEEARGEFPLEEATPPHAFEEEGTEQHPRSAGTRPGMRRWAQRFRDRLPRDGRIPRPLGWGLAAVFLAALAVLLWQSVPTRGPQAPPRGTTSSPPSQPRVSSAPPSSPQQPLPPEKEPAFTQPPEPLPVTPAGPLYPLEPFLIPLTTGAKEDRLLKVTMALELSSGQLSLELDDKLTRVREQVLAVLNSRTLSSLLNPEGKNQLRSDLIRFINQQLSTGAVRNLYFTEFIVL